MVDADEKDPGPDENDLVANRYRLNHKVAEGTGGSVWNASDPSGAAIALKFLKPQTTRSMKASTDHFKNEFAILKSLSHPNIASIYDFGVDTDNNRYFFTTELLLDGNLTKLIKAPIPLLESLLLDALRALEYLRANRLLHLDIKPQNLMIKKSGEKTELVMIDFGLASFRAPERAGGTASYMPPEVAILRMGRDKSPCAFPPADHRSDLYSLGVTFYYCLTGIQPFKSTEGTGMDAVENTLMKHLEYEPPPPSTYRPEIPKYLDRMIMKMISLHPDDRYPSAIIAAQAIQYGSPNAHEPESTATLLAYLPKEGKFIGRKDARNKIEEFVRSVIEGANNLKPVMCITGAHGVGLTRLLRHIKPFAQRLELDTTLIDSNNLSELKQLLESSDQTDDLNKLILFDDLDIHTRSSSGNSIISEMRALARRLRLQMRLPESHTGRIGFIFTSCNERRTVQDLLTDLNIDSEICKIIEIGNFTSEETSEYLAALLGEKPSDTVVQELLRCTGGNPTFITEHLEGMIAKGQLFSLAGRPDLSTLQTLGLDFIHAKPSQSLTESILETLSKITKSAQRLALHIACFMKPIGIDDLEATDRSDSLPGDIRALIAHGLIEKRDSDGKFVFANELAPRIICENSDQNSIEICHDAIASYLRCISDIPGDEIELHVAYGTFSDERLKLLDKIVDGCFVRGEYEQAIIHLKRRSSLIDDEDFRGKADTLVMLGKAYEKALRHGDAIQIYNKLKAMKAPDELSTEFKIIAYEHLGIIALRKRDMKGAKRSFRKAIGLMNEEGYDLATRLRLENHLAGVDLRCGLFENALERFIESKEISVSAFGDRWRTVVGNNELGEALLRSGKVFESIEILSSELSDALAAAQQERAANRHYLLGNAMRDDRIKKYKEAKNHYESGLAIAEELRLVELHVRLLNGMGNLNLKLGNPTEAMAGYTKALRLSQQIEGLATSVELMIGMGLASQQMQSFDDTIEFMEAALDFSKGPKGDAAGLIRRYMPTIFILLGDAYFQKHELDRAESYLIKAKGCERRSALSPDLRYSLYGTYAEILLDRGERDRARRLLPTLREITFSFPQSESHLKMLTDRLMAMH